MRNRHRSLGFCVLTPLVLFACTANDSQSNHSGAGFKIAAIADCQYADRENNGQKHYRTCPDKLSQAVNALNQQELNFVVHLGDLIDVEWQSFSPLLEIVGQSRHEFRFVLGNHDFDVADQFKDLVPKRLSMPSRYYSFSEGNWVFLVLDGNDVSTYGWPADSPQHLRNLRIKQARFPDAANWNGAIGDTQLAWMNQTLTDADANGQRAVLFSHFPVYPENSHNLWNADEVLAMIDRHRSVVAWFNGHNHDGNYGERNGVHYVNLKGMSDTRETAFSVITLHNDRIEIDGFGREVDRVLSLRGMPDARTLLE